MKLLCFGDSNTYGYDPRSYLGDRYPSSIRWVDKLAFQIINKYSQKPAKGGLYGVCFLLLA